jgi:bloom syndrome protein
VLTLYIVYIRFQVCKYPDKTKRRKNRLSLIKNVGSQIAILQQRTMDGDEDRYPLPRSNRRVDSNVGWMANRSNGSGQLGAIKRSSFALRDRDGGAKKVKADIALPPQLSKLSVDTMQGSDY